MINKYELKVYGNHLNSFIKYLYKSKIEIDNIIYNKDYILITVDYNNYLKFKKLKTTHKYIINRYFGKYFLKDFFDRNKLFILANFLGLCLILVFSQIIFRVDIITNDKELKKIINNYLIDKNISKYHFKTSYNYNKKVIEKLLTIYKDKLEWMEIEMSGVKVIVKLEPRKINEFIPIDKPKHIISKKDAIILKIDAISGEIVKSINNYVKKGDIIISGEIHKGDDIKKNIQAKGVVYGETWYNVTITLPKDYSEIRYSNKKTYNLNYQLFNFKKAFISPLSFKKQKYINIFKIENDILPLNISFDKEEEIIYDKNNYNNKELYKKAISKADKKIEDMLSKKEKIISRKELKKEINDSKIRLELFYKVYEDISEELLIPKEE